MTVLGKFSVVMADPPWDIHMEVHTTFILVLHKQNPESNLRFTLFNYYPVSNDYL